MSTISAGTTTTTALVSTGDTTGNLVLATGSVPTTALTLNSTTQAAAFAGPVGFASWTTATRPASPVVGQMGYNTTTGNFDQYTANGWVTPTNNKTYAICGAYNSSDSSPFNYNTGTYVNLNAVNTDNVSGFNTSTNTYTVQSGYAGKYIIQCVVRVRQNSGGQTNQLSIAIQKNGSNVCNAEIDNNATYFWGYTMPIMYVTTLAAGDTIKLIGSVSTGNGANTYYYVANSCTMFIQQIG